MTYVIVGLVCFAAGTFFGWKCGNATYAQLKMEYERVIAEMNTLVADAKKARKKV